MVTFRNPSETPDTPRSQRYHIIAFSFFLVSFYSFPFSLSTGIYTFSWHLERSNMCWTSKLLMFSKLPCSLTEGNMAGGSFKHSQCVVKRRHVELRSLSYSHTFCALKYCFNSIHIIYLYFFKGLKHFVLKPDWVIVCSEWGRMLILKQLVTRQRFDL